MLRRSSLLRQSTETSTSIKGGIKDFVDASYLNNKRPKVPGGAWPVDMLRKKSMGDLQQIWFLLLRERNMLLTMQHHYQRHIEELGAWPAPSRLRLVEDSMANIKRVLRERDHRANEAATLLFNERVAQRIYRYPPGPQAPPGSSDPTSRVTLLLSRHVSEERLRELFGRFDSFEDDRGLISVTVQPTVATMAAKEKAEEEFTKWWWAQDDAKEYARWSSSSFGGGSGGGGEAAAGQDAAAAASCFDTDVPFELAPGEFLQDVASKEELAALEARNVPVPPPLDTQAARATDMLERIRQQDRTYSEKVPIQLGYFPNVTSLPPPPSAGPRPVHPDEILGPWEATIVYTARDGGRYAQGLNVKRIDGADVLELTIERGDGAAAGAVEGKAAALRPAAADCMLYDEALGVEAAATEKEKRFPELPEWHEDYDKIINKAPEKIIQHNWQNAVDYMERESLLTGRSIYELPIDVDPTCGEQAHIPPFAKKPVEDFPRANKLHTNI
jgi:large subunit ribosomal protein L47